MKSDHQLRFRLSYKILAVFFILSVFSAVLSTWMLRYFAVSHFKQFVREMDMKVIGNMIPALADFYEERGGWDNLRQDRDLWEELVRDGLQVEFIRDPNRDQGPGPPGFHEIEPREPGGPPFRPPKPPDNKHPMMRIGLFDSEKRQVAGPTRTIDAFELQPIQVRGQTVGWLGLMDIPRPPDPIERDFIRRQFRVFYMVGAVLLLVSVLVAVLLSRNLLSPVRRLAEGTRALSLRRFDTRIPVESSDELGQLARDFNAMAEQLEQYEKRQKRWLTDISHELRTPLAILIGEIEALQDGVRNPDEKSLASLHLEASHLQRIVSDLHDLSLAEAESMPLNRRRIEPFAMLSEMVETLGDRSRTGGLDVVLDLPSGRNPSTDGDPDRLRQVFVNIFYNAVQHTDKPAKLIIQGRVSSRLVSISFEDSGPGVPDEALPFIFDRLYRVEESRSRTSGGSGLGLSICKSIVENHGGEIRAVKGRLGGLRIEIDLTLHEKTG